MIKFHPSSLGSIMTSPKLKSETLSETCKKHLLEVFIAHRYRRYKQFDNKYTQKGNEVEPESIRLFNQVNATRYKKNEVTIENDYLIGTPDVISENEIVDVKSSFDIFTFTNAKYGTLNKDYYYQLMGYMWLTGVKVAKLSYVLCNTPSSIILDEKKRLAWKMNSIEDESEEYIKECQYIERNSIYDMGLFQFDNPYFDYHSNPDDWEFDIPVLERIHTITINYDELVVEQIKAKIIECRNWMDNNLFNIPDRIDIDLT